LELTRHGQCEQRISADSRTDNRSQVRKLILIYPSLDARIIPN